MGIEKLPPSKPQRDPSSDHEERQPAKEDVPVTPPTEPKPAPIQEPPATPGTPAPYSVA